MKSTKLTPKQEAFVREYLIDLNATQAAIRAGYSAKTAQEQSSRLLSKAMVVKAVQTGMDKRADKLSLTAEDVLRDINLVKEDAMRQNLDRDGNMNMANHAAALKALELQGRHLKLFTDRVETNIKGTLKIVSEFEE
jgi:phage terminase small subunit